MKFLVYLIQKLSKLGALTFLLLAFNANCIAGGVSASNLISNLNSSSSGLGTSTIKPVTTAPNNAGVNQPVILSEIHLVTTTSPMTVAAYLPYTFCPNGGQYVQGSLTTINATTLYYFCSLPILAWYLDPTNPVYYDAAKTTTYLLEYNGPAGTPGGLIPNPSLPATNTVATEQISTNPIFSHGSSVTFKTNNCAQFENSEPTESGYALNYENWSAPGYNQVMGAVYSSVSISLGLQNETDTPGSSNPNSPLFSASSPPGGTSSNYIMYAMPSINSLCTLRATSVVSVYLGQTVTITVTLSSPAIADYSPGGQDARWQSLSDYQTLTVTGTYTIQPTDLGNFVYVNVNPTGCGWYFLGYCAPVLSFGNSFAVGPNP